MAPPPSLPRRFALPLLLLASLGGCAQFEVRAHPDPAIDYARFGTFGWLPLAKAAPIDQDTGNRNLNDRIYRAVETDVEAKGWAPAPNDSADLLFTFRLLRAGNYDDTRLPYGTSWTRSSYMDALHESASSYSRGTLIIDVIERTTNEIVWRGSASGRLLAQPSYERMVERADEAVQQILATFPVRRR